MSMTEAIQEKVSALPPKKQAAVLHFVESISKPPAKVGKSHAWLAVAIKADLKGPADWSEHLDDHLYGDKKNAR